MVLPSRQFMSWEGIHIEEAVPEFKRERGGGVNTVNGYDFLDIANIGCS